MCDEVLGGFQVVADDSVFAGVIGEDEESSVDAQYAFGLLDQVGKCCEFIVDGDAQCLEYACEESFAFSSGVGLEDGDEVGGGDDGLLLSCFNDCASEPFGGVEVAVFFKDFLEGLFGGGFEELLSGFGEVGVEAQV